MRLEIKNKNKIKAMQMLKLISNQKKGALETDMNQTNKQELKNRMIED